MGNVRKGLIAGPCHFPRCQIPTILLYPSEELSTPGQLGLIRKLGPHINSSGNANIPRHCAKMEYATIDEAVAIINS